MRPFEAVPRSKRNSNQTVRIVTFVGQGGASLLAAR